jgi:hypothetical protein
MTTGSLSGGADHSVETYRRHRIIDCQEKNGISPIDSVMDIPDKTAPEMS